MRMIWSQNFYILMLKSRMAVACTSLQVMYFTCFNLVFFSLALVHRKRLKLWDHNLFDRISLLVFFVCDHYS